MANDQTEFRHRLPLGKSIIGAFLVTWSSRKIFASALAVPLTCLVLLTLLQFYANKDLPTAMEWSVDLFYLLFFCIFSVICHRIVLLDAPPNKGWRLHWSWRETRFFMWMVSIWSIVALALVLAATLTMPIAVKVFGIANSSNDGWVAAASVLAWAPAFYLIGRLCLIFPATALEKKPNLR